MARRQAVDAVVLPPQVPVLLDTAAVVLPDKVDLTVYGGDDVRFSFVVTSGANPFQLTGPFLCQVRAATSATVALGELQFTAVSPASGVGELYVPGDVTSDLLASSYAKTVKTTDASGTPYQRTQFVGVYDLQMGNPGSVVTICRGSFTVEGDVSRQETP